MSNSDHYILKSPAISWEEASLLGNGTIGALVMGNVENEILTLTHEKLFIPVDTETRPILMGQKLTEIRQLIQKKKYSAASQCLVSISRHAGYNGKLWHNPFAPAANLEIRTQDVSLYQDYSRSLNFSTGESCVEFTAHGTRYKRKCCISRLERFGIMELNSSRPANYDIKITKVPVIEEFVKPNKPLFLEDGKEDFLNFDIHTCPEGKNQLVFLCRYRGQKSGYAVIAHFDAVDGKITSGKEAVRILGARHVSFVFTVEPLADVDNDWHNVLKRLDWEKDYQKLRHETRENFKKQYGRVRLRLNGADRGQTDHQLWKYTKWRFGGITPEFMEKIFYAGRYEIISAAGEWPPNLQGLWAGSYNTRWSSDYTHDGNLQTAILSMLPAGDWEGMEAYFRYHENFLEHYRKNSMALYGCRGIHIPAHTTDNGYDLHFDAEWPLLYWISGAGWTSHFYYDYWLYTQDDDFFKYRALPFMKEAALFYEDFLLEDENGKWLFSPSYSPENTPLNADAPVCINATMDISIAKELFRNLITGCVTLGIEGENVLKWRRILDKMPDFLIDEEGALKEWCSMELEERYDHRHSSQLYLLFYDDARHESEEVRMGARKAYEMKLERRLSEAGQMAFGLVQIGMVAAHLRDKGTVGAMLESMGRNNYYRTYASAHDFGPSIFNADISGGIPALIMEGIAQCFPVIADSCIQSYEISLLPALPDFMKSGSISGMHLRGGFILEMEWKEGNVVTWKLDNPYERTYQIN